MKVTAKKDLNKILIVCLIISLIVGMTPATFAKAAPTIAISGTANNLGNYIALNWSNSGSAGSYRYMVTKKDGSSTTYQTIPLKRTAKVLNIYPGGGTPIAGRTDLEGRQLDTSANVKLWMEEEGVGKSNGNTLITVDCISISDFNSNPGNYLYTDNSGNYNYDVVFTGAWDNNNYRDLNNSSKSVIQNFITAGGGYLGGHDTTNGYNNRNPYFNALARDNLNMAIGSYTMIPLYGGSNPTSTIDINIVKKGSLINYPWTVSGTTLTVPSSHSTHQFAMGDVWMKYTSSEFNTFENTFYNGNAGTNNFYLTTWNNAAMIQTGHSNGNATIDEKKILANTLLYLAQISTETTFDDHTAQDVMAPNSIDASTVQINVGEDNKATVTFAASEDNGNTYSYQLKAMGMTDNSTTWSEPISQTIMSGMNGYAIVVDEIAATVPDDTVTTTDCTYETTALSAGTWYAHIKAIDNVGNASSVIHVPFTVSQADTDVQAVAAAKAAIVNSSVNVAFGADQTAKTAAVQTYVDGIISNTANAAGVTAAVIYNSTTGNYDVAITKGSANDSKSLTMTVIIAPDPDIATVNSAKTGAENASYLDMTQAQATNEAAIVDTLKTAAETAVNDNSIIIIINKLGYTAPIAGTSANPSGTDGSYVFTITVSKGLQSQTTEQKTIRIAATAYTGVTDVQAVAAAMEALVDGSANVAFGADQATKTAAVQAYVNGILSSTANAAGVSAAVTYNSSTGKYEITITKGSISDSKSLTMTLNVAPDPDIAAVDAAKAAAQNASYLDMTQETATGEAAIVSALKATAEAAVNNSSVNITINKVDYTAPISGTSANPSGTDGSYSFTVRVSKGAHNQTTEQKTIRIAATAYTGITDVQAVAAAMEALVDGSANVAFGADQTTKTAAVQAYVNGILSSTANAAGVSAAVTYNSSTGQYEVTITKGSISDSKSLTMTLNETIDPDIAAIDAAKAAAQNASYLDMTQAVATGETAIVSALKAAAEAAVSNSSVTITIDKVSYTEPTAGTSINPSGTNGSYVFTITVTRGLQSQTTEQKTISITAEAYTGLTDVQAVAAAKEALVDGSAMIPFGADQAIKTAAVQAYVNGILSGMTDAAGVSAAVTYNSTTGQYEVTIMKGSSSDSKCLTMTLNETTDPDIVVVNDSRLAVEGVSYANMTQAEANNETVIADSLKTAAVTAVTGGAITVTINKISYTAPISGTSANPSGTDGSYVFTITVSKGLQSQSTAQKTITIIASAYTGVTDVQAVAAIKAALVDVTVNVPYGADQAAIIAAVQAYVNDKLSSTADAVGVTAVVTYNSSTGKYEVALSKGSINDSKSLTMTVIAAPAPSEDSQTFVTKPETKTITVIEVPHSIPNERLLMVEPVGEAFDKSVEVRLKEDTVTEGMVRMVMESLSSTLNIENAQIFPLDISIYLKGTDTKVQPKEGTAVIITCPIPAAMLTNMDKLVVVCVIDEELKVLPSTLVMKDGVACAQFTATHFSPYAFVIDYDNNLADNAEGTLYDDVTHISANLTAAAGTLTKIDLDGIKEGSTITYHVCTPTLISIDNNGNLFTKKAGNAILMANVTYDGAVTTYTIHITVKKAKGGTKVGFIQYYDDIVSCNNINYRITAEATDKAEGTAAVANNQINKNLPQKVVIPATITYQGKTYKVTSIDESAFYNMNNITSVTIPAGVEEISTTAFVSCDSLKTFTVSSDNKHYSAKKGMLLNKEGTILIAYPSAKGTIIIDKKIKVIGAYAFSACKYLTGVVIPKTVTRIEGCAFSNSKSLSKVTFQSMTVPEIPFLGIFEKVNEACTILVPGNHLSKYQAAFKNARMPKGASVIKSELK